MYYPDHVRMVQPDQQFGYLPSISTGDIVANQQANRLHRRMAELQKDYAEVVAQEEDEERQRGDPSSWL